MSRSGVHAPERTRLDDVLWCAAWVLLSRLILLAVGVSARLVMGDKLGFTYAWSYADALWLDIWGVWDTGWYLDIIQNGYDAAPKGEGAIAGQANWAFFPFYPYVSKAVAAFPGIGAFPALLLVANASFLGAVCLLWTETKALFGKAAARAAVALLCVVPGTYIFSSGYTESLFLFLTLASLALARRRHWLWAGGVAALAVLTRNLGIMLLVPFAVMAWPILRERLGGGQTWREMAAALQEPDLRAIVVAFVLPVLALIGFMAFLALQTGNPLAFVTIQDAWQRTPSNPFYLLFAPLADPGQLPARDVMNWIMAWSAVCLVGAMAWWRHWALAAFAACLIFFPLTAGLTAVLRYMIVVFPALMAAGALLAHRPRGLIFVMTGLGVMNGFLMTSWSLGFPNVF